MSLHPTLLIVEDDTDLLAFLRQIFIDQSYTVHTATLGSIALKLAEQTKPDLVLLDLGLPDIDGESLCREIKKIHPTVPIIILTARDSVTDLVRNLNKGADDYMTKPFDSDELVARVKARLRKSIGTETILTAGDVSVNLETMEVTRGEKLIPLTFTEFQLLAYLMANKNRVLSREMILSHVWSYTPDIESRVVDVYVGYLRRKVDAQQDKKLIHSVRGFGYVLKDE